MKSSAILAVMILVFLGGVSPAAGQDTGIPDSARFEPNPATWTINSDADSVFSIELWGFSDQNIGALSLGFELLINGGSGMSLYDSLIVVDTFIFDAALEWDIFGYARSCLQPEYGSQHLGFNGFLMGGLGFNGYMLQPSVPTKLGDLYVKVLDPYGLPESFEIVVDSSFFPPAGSFKFSPGRRTFMVGYAPVFSATTIVVENNLGIPVIPEINLAPEAFEFTAEPDGVDPFPQIMQISNSGNGTLQWTASDDADWLTLFPSTGVGDSPCTLV